jgi:Holliday junction resolvasome RuvABC endonuclease subunit
MRIVGIDPGLASFGLAIFDTRSACAPVPFLGVHTTKPSARKRGVLSADDWTDRLRTLTQWAARTLPWDARVLCAESMSFPRSASAAAKMASTWGVITALAYERDMAVLQVSPQALKKWACGKNNASKEDVQAAMKARFPAGTFASFEEAHAAGLYEHGYDALAAACYAATTDLVRAAR